MKPEEYNVYARQKDGKWQYIITYYVAGKRKTKSGQGFKTEKLALKTGNSVALDMVIEEPKEKVNLSFKECFDLWIGEKQISINTEITYEMLWRHYKELYEKDIAEITYTDIAKIFNVEKKKSHSTAVTHMTILNGIFKYAKKMKAVSYNPVDDLEYQKEKKQKEERKAFTESELKDFIDKLPDEYKVIASVQGYAGLRLSEARGLMWSDINFKDKTITVQRQKIEGNIVTPILKSNNGYREIFLSPVLERVLLSSPRRIDGFVTGYVKSSQYNYVLKKADGQITSHNLRHTFATILIGKGIDFKTVAELLGDNVQTVISTYAHSNSDMMENARQKIMEML